MKFETRWYRRYKEFFRPLKKLPGFSYVWAKTKKMILWRNRSVCMVGFYNSNIFLLKTVLDV